jgi:hypothetical protein
MVLSVAGVITKAATTVGHAGAARSPSIQKRMHTTLRAEPSGREMGKEGVADP